KCDEWHWFCELSRLMVALVVEPTMAIMWQHFSFGKRGNIMNAKLRWSGLVLFLATACLLFTPLTAEAQRRSTRSGGVRVETGSSGVRVDVGTRGSSYNRGYYNGGYYNGGYYDRGYYDRGYYGRRGYYFPQYYIDW